MNHNTKITFKDITQSALLNLLETDNDVDYMQKGETPGRYDLALILKDNQSLGVYTDKVKLITAEPMEGVICTEIERLSFGRIDVI